MKYNHVVVSLSMLFLSSCAPSNQESTDYTYTHNYEVAIRPISNAKNHDVEILNFPIYGAFSESIYLEDDPDKVFKNMDTFCNSPDESLYRPREWKKITNLNILKEKKYEQQPKLEIEVFTKKVSNNESIALIVFRGTHFKEKESWVSNFRWFTRYFSFKLDQYDEVRILTPLLISEIEKFDTKISKFVTTGHSVGGGLAQLAGYSSHKIDTVFAFDSSPVTGFYDIESSLRRFNSQNLKIYRIYENGGILSYLRMIKKFIFPVSKEHPDIVQIRFDLIQSKSVINQPSIKPFVCKLYQSVS